MSARKSGLSPWLWAGPTLLILAGFLVYPVIVTIYDSLLNSTLTKFVGPSNYLWALTTEGSLIAFRNNIFWIILGTVATVGLGLVFAVLADRVRYESVIKALIFMPMAISFVGAGVIWKFMYDWKPAVMQQIGLLNALLLALSAFATTTHTLLLWLAALAGVVALVTFFIGVIRARAFLPSFLAIVVLPALAIVFGWLVNAIGAALGIPSSDLALLVEVVQLVIWIAAAIIFALAMAPDRAGKISIATAIIAAICLGLLALTSFQPVTWIQDDATNNWALAIVYIWIWTGFCLVVLSAALKGIPSEVIEAARVDGADEFQVFAQVLAPMISPTMLVVATTMVINILKVFDIVYVMTSGDYKTDVIANAMYYQTLIYQNFGRGATLAVVLLAAVIPVMIFNIRRFRAEEALR